MIGDVRHLPRKDFDKPPVTLAESIRRVCSGIFQLGDDLLVVLDVEKILEEETIMRTPIMTRKRLVFNRTQNGGGRLPANAGRSGDRRPARTRPAKNLRRDAAAEETERSSRLSRPKPLPGKMQATKWPEARG